MKGNDKTGILRRRQRLLLRSLMLLAAVCAAVFWHGPGAEAESSFPVAGITEPISDVTMSLSVPGIVSVISVKEGERVRQGQQILHLDKRAEELEVARRKLVWESKAEEQGAAARARILEEIFQSTLDLYHRTKSVSTEDLKKSELEYKLAAAEKDRLKMVEVREKLEYEMALDALEKRILRSPVNGVVTRLFYDVGESCEEHQPLVRVVDTNRGRFVCNMEESLGRTLEKGREVNLSIASGETPIEKKGKVSFVSPVVDSASGLMEVKVEFDNPDGQVRPGMAATMIFDLP
jgi:RND family efflux transporter MFP subunit